MRREHARIGTRTVSRSAALATLLLSLMVAADCAWADNLGGLVFLLFIWPAGVLACAVFGILTIVTMVKLGKGDTAPTGAAFHAGAMIASGAVALLFPVFAVVLERAFTAGASLEMMLISIAPVEIITVLCLALNWWAIRARRGSA